MLNQIFFKKLSVVILSVCILSCWSFQSHAAVKMPQFSLPAVTDGKVVESSSFEGKAMLVTFFATWCAPCRQEIPVLKELHQKYRKDGFSVVALSVDEKGPAVVAKLVEQVQIPYPVLMADQATPRKFGGIVGIPTSFLVNKAGHVVKKYPGYIPRPLLEKDIKSVL